MSGHLFKKIFKSENLLVVIKCHSKKEKKLFESLAILQSICVLSMPGLKTNTKVFNSYEEPPSLYNLYLVDHAHTHILFSPVHKMQNRTKLAQLFLFHI